MVHLRGEVRQLEAREVLGIERSRLRARTGRMPVIRGGVIRLRKNESLPLGGWCAPVMRGGENLG